MYFIPKALNLSCATAAKAGWAQSNRYRTAIN